MKKTIIALLAIIMLLSMSITAFAAETAPEATTTLDMSEEAVYERLMTVKDTNGFRENENHNSCTRFANDVQKLVFPNEVGRRYYDFDLDNLRVGDVIRINNNTHSCIVLKIDIENNRLYTADGNYGGKITWQRVRLLKETLAGVTYVMTRYPKDGAETVTVTAPAETATPATTTTPAQTTVTETKPATTATTGTRFVIVNNSTGTSTNVTVTDNTATSFKTKNITGTVIGARKPYDGLSITMNGTTAVVTYNGITHNVTTGQTITL